MSIDRSLKGANTLVRHRNVLNRAERLEKLKEDEKWDETKSVFALPKVAHRKAAVGGKAAKEEEAAAAAATAGAEGAPAAGAAPAAGVGVPAGAKGASASAAPAAKGKK